MHCPECGKCVGCRCYKKLETALDRIEDKNADFCCSAKCVLYTSTGIDKIDIKMAILAIVQKNSPIPKIEDLSEKQAQDIIDYFINIGYFDNPGDLGEECEL